MSFTDTELGRVLVEQNYLSQEEVNTAIEQVKQHGGTLKSVLFELNLLTQELFESAVAEYYKLPHFDIRKAEFDPKVVLGLPEEVARKCNTIIVGRDENAITIATSDPSVPNLEEIIRTNIDHEEAVLPEESEETEESKETPNQSTEAHGSGQAEESEEKKEQEEPKEAPQKKGLSLSLGSFSFGRKKDKQEVREPFTGDINFVYAPQSNIEALFVHYRKPLATRFQAIIDSSKTVAPEILEEIINDAIELNASDIHFEPQEETVSVRFRVDGVMHEAGSIPREHYEGVVNRIKIESNMRIDEHFAAQDGAIRYSGHGDPLDIRVSIVPLVDGEKVVMRLLSAYVSSITLAELGFAERNQKILEEAAQKPFGMILTTGPTGSGKSTTLYALIKMRNSPDVNISTIEDPVEYKMRGVNHIQVNEKTGLTFAKGLRALVRQDPDVILVGEIRDSETATIAVNAALTGHLLFSTLHANDAATAVPRLLEMDVEPFLLASTVEVIIAQRLVRRLCAHCRYSYAVTREEIAKTQLRASEYFPETGSMLLYRGKGCESCGGTGYKGRLGIHELLVMTPEVEDLIMKRATTTEINRMARKQGMRYLFEDGFEKMKRGVTSLEELLRVAAPPSEDLGMPVEIPEETEELAEKKEKEESKETKEAKESKEKKEKEDSKEGKESEDVHVAQPAQGADASAPTPPQNDAGSDTK